MSYHRPPRTALVGRVRGPGGALSGFGDAAGFVAGDQLPQLAAQVNRFGPGAPAAYQFTSKVFPLASGKIDPEIALVATTIYLRRATDAFSQFHDAGSAAAIARANLGFADPVGFVTANLADVVTTIGSFADSLGLPAASAAGPIPGLPSTIAGIDTTTILWVAGGAVALWMVTR
jgi:hypothetical protein